MADDVFKTVDTVPSTITEQSEFTNNKEMVCGQTNVTEESRNSLLIRESMLKSLSTNDKVYFGPIKEGEDDLTEEKKTIIASELLDRSYGLFLAKFGNHLLEEHLCYFADRSEEDSLIVDMHLKQLQKAFEQQRKIKASKQVHKVETNEDQMEVASELSLADGSRLKLRDELLQHLCSCPDAHFRSQQVGEPDLSCEEKREIAENVLERSCSLFLAKFGNNLLEEHLEYFDKVTCPDNYEVQHYLKRLRKTHCKSVSEIEIRNRRFEALKKMIDEGSYFSETEMRNRNPLLYEQLVGKHLSAEERRERLNNIDTTNITFVNLLLEQMDREAVKKLKKEQEDAEDDAMEEEEDSSIDEQMEDEEYDSEEDNDLDKSLWGEKLTDEELPSSTRSKNKPMQNKKTKEPVKNIEEDESELTEAERYLLMEEFRTSMFSSFLQGKDTDFDYKAVDYNSDYDDLEAQGQDEEDKYFDEDSSQSGSLQRMSEDEDSLDKFMIKLKPDPTPAQLAEEMQNLSHQET